jgi:hypothetical protein
MKRKTSFFITNRTSILFVDKHNLHIQHCNNDIYVHGREEESIQGFGGKDSQKETTRETLMQVGGS